VTNEHEKEADFWVGYMGETLAKVAEEREINEARKTARVALKAILRSGFALGEQLRARFTSAIIDLPDSDNGEWYEPSKKGEKE
jgi:hypothetical protein